MAIRPATRHYLGAFAGMGVATLLLGPSLETFRETTGVDLSTIGLLFTATAAGYLVGAALGGRLLATHRVHSVLAVGVGSLAVAVATLPFLGSLRALLVFEALLGFGNGFIDVSGNAVVLWVHKGGPMLNALHLCFALGAVGAPLLVSRSLAWTDGLYAAYLPLSVALAAGAVAIWRRPSPHNPHLDIGHGVPAGSGRLVALGFAFFFVYVGVELGFAGWIFEYAVDRGMARTGSATWLGTAFLASFAFGRALSIPIAARVRPATVLAVDIGISMLALTVLLVGGSNVAALWAGTIGFGVAIASMFPSMFSLSEPHLPSTGFVTGAFLVGSSVGSMIIPWQIGVLLDRSGAAAMPAVVLAWCALLGVIVFAFRATARRRALLPSSPLLQAS